MRWLELEPRSPTPPPAKRTGTPLFAFCNGTGWPRLIRLAWLLGLVGRFELLEFRLATPPNDNLELIYQKV